MAGAVQVTVIEVDEAAEAAAEAGTFERVYLWLLFDWDPSILSITAET